MLCLYRSITPTILLFIQEAIDCHALIHYEYLPPTPGWRETLLACSAVLRLQRLNFQVDKAICKCMVATSKAFWSGPKGVFDNFIVGVLNSHVLAGDF